MLIFFLNTVAVRPVSLQFTTVILGMGNTATHVVKGLLEITLVERGMVTHVAIHWATNVSTSMESRDSLRAMEAVRLMKTVTIDFIGELVALQIVVRGKPHAMNVVLMTTSPENVLRKSTTPADNTGIMLKTAAGQKVAGTRFMKLVYWNKFPRSLNCQSVV